MKEIIIGFLIVIAIAVISFLIFKSCQDKPNIPPDNSRIEELEQRERQHLTHIALIQSKIDSLQNLKSQVVTSIIWRTTQIDSAIAKDSSNSLVEYRRSLQDNNYLPDGTLYLSYREIGLGAIL